MSCVKARVDGIELLHGWGGGGLDLPPETEQRDLISQLRLAPATTEICTGS
jgi:hypothetical protein